MKRQGFPLEGLTFDETGWRLNDVPLAQASQAQKLRLCVAIGCVINPRIKIMLIRDGAWLDDERLALLDELARKNGMQVIVERVGKSDAGAVIIEDGEVLGMSDGTTVAAE